MIRTPNVPVVVIVGAGASLASGVYDPAEAPPLTYNLFDNQRAQGFIHNYPTAHQAGRVISRLLQENEAMSFEEALLSLRESRNPRRRHMSVGIPLFLQELLLRTSEQLFFRAERYDQLIDVLSELPTHAHYVTLNYDTLLDNRLHAFQPLSSLNQYIDRSRDWSLIKLHGSVNWGYPVISHTSYDHHSPPDDLVFDRSMLACAPPTVFNLSNLRAGIHHSAADGRPLYPALALPEGPKDELIAPPDHQGFLFNAIAQAPQIDVLVLGYSALDNEVLGLIKATRTEIRRLTVVNRDAGAALGVYKVIQNWELPVIWPDVFPASFTTWVDQGGLSTWAREYGGPYSSIFSPDQVEQALIEDAYAEQAIQDEIDDSIANISLEHWEN